MALIAQMDKICILSKRETNFTDDKTGKPQIYRYVTGFDCTNGTAYSDVAIDAVSPVTFEKVEENAVYDCIYKFSVIKGEKNAQRLTSVKIERKIGTIELKPSK